MVTKSVACLELCETSGSSSEVKRKQARALRYDNLASVLINVDEHVRVPAKRKRDRNSGGASTEQLSELRATVASLRAENERLAERVTSDLEMLAERVAELEARAQRPWWRRVFHVSGQGRGGGRPKALARLRALSVDSANPEFRPA